MATTGKLALVLFEKAIDTHEKQIDMLGMVNYMHPDDSDMQNSDNTNWLTVQQHRPIVDGFDTTGLATDIIEETVPIALGTPKNDVFEQRVDNMRDLQFWERAGQESGIRQASELNRRLAALVANTGSLYYDASGTNSGYTAISQGQAILNERQKNLDGMRYAIINDRDNLTYSAELAGRQTLQGRPENAWKTGQIGANVAGFDVYTGSFLPAIVGNAAANSTTSAAVSDKPESGSVNNVTNTVTNIDYRFSVIPMTATANYNVGDRVKFVNAGTDVQSLGLMDKTETGQAITAVITAKDAGTITVFPKLIAADDAALSTLEKAYANIDTQITAGADVVKLNNFVGSKKSNIFFCKNAIQVTGGNAPVSLLNEFGGMKVVSSTMENGQIMYMAYDGDIDKLTFKCRLFTWYGETMLDPSACGSFVG